jgi:DNA-binding XRE family transcriptional regulator
MQTTNSLRSFREGAHIEIPVLARAAGVSERTIRKIESADGSDRIEIKSRLAAALKRLTGDDMAQVETLFPGWEQHRRDAKKK